MPKYYRFRASTPIRKLKRKERERDQDIEKPKIEHENWVDFTVACSPVPSWYLRRTSWRKGPVAGVPRPLAGLQASLQINNRSIFVIKLPYTSNTITSDLLRPL